MQDGAGTEERIRPYPEPCRETGPAVLLWVCGLTQGSACTLSLYVTLGHKVSPSRKSLDHGHLSRNRVHMYTKKRDKLGEWLLNITGVRAGMSESAFTISRATEAADCAGSSPQTRKQPYEQTRIGSCFGSNAFSPRLALDGSATLDGRTDAAQFDLGGSLGTNKFCIG